jgi:hypothetical protein
LPIRIKYAAASNVPACRRSRASMLFTKQRIYDHECVQNVVTEVGKEVRVDLTPRNCSAVPFAKSSWKTFLRNRAPNRIGGVL